MLKKKDNYEKPQLKGERLFEAGAKTCCKTLGPCTNANRNATGKNSRETTTS